MRFLWLFWFVRDDLLMRNARPLSVVDPIAGRSARHGECDSCWVPRMVGAVTLANLGGVSR